MRLTSEQLTSVKEKYGVEELWSYSRFDTYRISPYLFFLKYVKEEQPTKEYVSPYGVIGNAAHNILERLYNGEIEYDKMSDEFETEYVTQIDMLGLKFNNSDNEMNDRIANKYKADLIHFFKNYTPIPNKKIKMEQFVATQIEPGIVFQGYIDAVYKDDDGNYTIVDFKTSSKSGYTGEGLKKHSAQLILYCKALEQMGVNPTQIKACFNMLKYVQVDFEQKNGEVKPVVIERCEIGSKLQAKARTWLRNFKYTSDQIDVYLAQMLTDNSIDCLPDEVKAKFGIGDCYIYVDNPFEQYEELKQEIVSGIEEIHNRIKEYERTQDDHVFWDPEELLEKNTYFHLQLSDYQLQQHLPMWEYIERLEREKEAEEESKDLLGVTRRNAETANDSDDLSWMDELV